MKRRTIIHRIEEPCAPGFAGKWCLGIYGMGTVWFDYFLTRREAREEAKRIRS